MFLNWQTEEANIPSPNLVNNPETSFIYIVTEVFLDLMLPTLLRELFL